MTEEETVELRRGCPAVLVPSGRPIIVPRGRKVTLVQRLEGSITVEVGHGVLARIDGTRADALGLEARQDLCTSDGLSRGAHLHRGVTGFDAPAPES